MACFPISLLKSHLGISCKIPAFYVLSNFGTTTCNKKKEERGETFFFPFITSACQGLLLGDKFIFWYTMIFFLSPFKSCKYPKDIWKCISPSCQQASRGKKWHNAAFSDAMLCILFLKFEKIHCITYRVSNLRHYLL